VALVRVYCGLASADRTARPASAGPVLTAAVVDDAGRLLDVCEISDDPVGYARLNALLVERSSGPSGAAIATDSDDHVVTSLLTAAGRPLVVADDDAADDYAERFADDESLEEMESPPAQRGAVGLARALQAGALSAVTLPAARDLAPFKPVLAAHTALANGRQAAAVALREVLRELYPAALRAYPDPAEPVALAVLNALPEPGTLTGTSSRNRELSIATDAVVAHLAADGVADAETINEAVTALRVAIVETPRRGAINQTLTSATAETVRHAVAAVRACDAAADALIATLTARVSTPTPMARRRTLRRTASVVTSTPPAGAPDPGLHAVRKTDTGPTNGRVPSDGRRSRPQPVSGAHAPPTPQPMTRMPVAPPPVAPPPTAPAPMAPAARLAPARPTEPIQPTSAAPATAGHRDEPSDYPRMPAANRPISAPPPPPPGIMPMPAQRPVVAPADAGEPFRATITTAAMNSARAERRPTPITPRPNTRTTPPPAGQPTVASPPSGPPFQGGFGATDYTLPVPTPRPVTERPAPGSRANWPLIGRADEQAGPGGRDAYPVRDSPVGTPQRPSAATLNVPPGPEGRVTPPWLADDLPQEPPALRLVEPPPPTDAVLGEGLGGFGGQLLETPPLRLVEPSAEEPGRAARGRRAAAEHGTPPVNDEGDGDLLIFAAARSAWFVRHPEEAEVDFVTSADSGWRAAEQAAQPATGSATQAGLPKRVPQANLVPGSPLRDERPLRIVRDAASIAEHTNGYFRGWRRGQEIGGYAVGGRPGRESAGGWDFSRDQSGQGESQFEHHPASHRS